VEAFKIVVEKAPVSPALCSHCGYDREKDERWKREMEERMDCNDFMHCLSACLP